MLRDVTLRIAAGETVAFVGPSGAGKSTLCALLPRFYDLDAGRITIDGIDITCMTLESLRRQIGVVQQDVFLFAGTLRENIAYGRLGASEAEIVEAAERARLGAMVADLPDGLDTVIGQRGVKLSGGQRQRVAIARMFLKNPPILILDEATSALDSETERAIQQSLSELAVGRTSLVVAHRLATVRDADRIVVVEGRGVVEQGAARAAAGGRRRVSPVARRSVRRVARRAYVSGGKVLQGTEIEWRRLRADELREAATPETVVILPVASIEQHGPHLPVEVDSVLAEAVALATARAMTEQGGRALVLPTLWTGISEHHMSFGGTITLDATTFAAVVEQICRSVVRLGFQRIALLNGHGGNDSALRVAADDLTPRLGRPVVALTYWHVAAAEIAKVLTAQTRLLHACEAETSMMLALRPDLVAMDRAPPPQPAPEDTPGLHRWRTLAQVSSVGVIGEARAASAEKGRRLLAAISATLAQALMRPGVWE